MKILIEFYHRNILENMVAVLGLKPDIVMFYFDAKYFTTKAVYNTYLACKRYIPHLKLELGSYDCEDFSCIDEKLGGYVSQNMKDEVFIDLTGSNELAAVACYRTSEKYPVSLLWSDIRHARLMGLNAPEKLFGCHSFEIADIIEACGGKVLAHADSTYLDKNKDCLYDIALKVMEHASGWSQLCSYFQRYCSRYEKKLHFIGPKEDPRRNGKYILDEKLLYFIAKSRLIQNLEITDESIEFDFKDTSAINHLTTYGIWLEFLTYYALKESKEFHDVKNSLKVDWNRSDGRDIIGNEIDVTAMYGCIPVVISCKMSENATDADAINELYTVSHRVSRGHVIRILVTFGNIKQHKLGIYMKAREMGIIIIDNQDICRPDFAKVLERAIVQRKEIIR